MTRKTACRLVVALLACLLVLLPGCRKGVAVQNFSSPMPLVQKQSDKEITAAIIRAGAVTNWEITPVRPGLLAGSLTVRGKHTVVVDIAYTQSDYKITYRSSTNMEYTPEGMIHPNYNKWVATLDANIRRELSKLNS
jgi:hypothetical protein